MATHFNPDKKLLKELIVYIAKRCRADQSFGAVKLNKILWRSDFMAYAQEGAPITGSQYIKQPKGPVARQLPAAQRELQEEERIVIVEETAIGGYKQKITVARTDPDLSGFTASQISIVGEVIDEYFGLTASEVSQRSHGKAWEVASDREVIPYEAVFLADRITHDDRVRAREICERLAMS